MSTRPACPQGQKVCHQHSARAVNRAQRAEQKAAVDEAPELHSLQVTSMHQPKKEQAKKRRTYFSISIHKVVIPLSIWVHK